MLLKETMDTLCVQNEKLLNITIGGSYVNTALSRYDRLQFLYKVKKSAD